MPIELSCETLISLAEAASLCPKRRRGKKPHVSCIYRWTSSGCRGVVLESIQVGGTRCTSRDALQRFFERLTGSSTPSAPAPTSLHRRKQIAEAERILDRAGI